MISGWEPAKARPDRVIEPHRLRSVRPQTLVLAGDDDPIVPLINGRIFARCVPNARLHIIRHGGHLFLLESPAEIAALVAAFLSGDHLPSDPAIDP